MQHPVYLDYAATTPVDPAVAETMVKHMMLDGCFGNPASRSHRYGWQAEEAVETAREQVASLINADPREIIFTSGATESNNLAIKGVAFEHQDKGKHIITLTTEHKAVLDTCAWLGDNGFDVTFLDVESNGLVDLNKLNDAIRDDTILVSIMMVNNEIGVIQDIAQIGQICRDKGVYFHVDGVQALGKIPVDVSELNVDLMSFTAHKLYGPKGSGALYVKRRPKVRIAAQMHGGSHERGMRSGTLATHQIVGLGAACRVAGDNLLTEMERIRTLKMRFLSLIQTLPEITINGDLAASAPGILNVSFADVDGETLLMALKDLAVSSGSACNSATMEPSFVLKALGLSNELAHSSIRFSFGRFTTEEEVEFAAEKVCSAVTILRSNNVA